MEQEPVFMHKYETTRIVWNDPREGVLPYLSVSFFMLKDFQIHSVCGRSRVAKATGRHR